MAQDTPKIASRKLPAWIIAVVAAAAILVYLNTLWNDFVFDDIPIVGQNPNIRGLSKSPAIFSSGYGEGTQLGFTALYRPLVILSLAANYQVGGLAPWRALPLRPPAALAGRARCRHRRHSSAFSDMESAAEAPSGRCSEMLP